MLYVVVIEREDAKKDYKVYAKSADAIRRHRTASYHVASSEPARIGGEEMCIVSCSMFRAATNDVREAIRLVNSGSAEQVVPEEHPAEKPGRAGRDDL
jgi:hypothetical protein